MFRKYHPTLCFLFTFATVALAVPQSSGATAAEILASVRTATGGDAWNQFAECDSEGSITLSGKTGAIHTVENLHTGASVTRADVPDLGIKQAYAVAPDGIWQQDDAGDVRLLPAGQPFLIDDLYLTSHGYWRPNFGGAVVKVLDPAVEKSTAYDRLQFQVPGGRGFTLWINRSTHFIERSVTDSTTKYLGDYRPVEGVLLPFSQRSGTGDQEQIITLTKRTLINHIDDSAFAAPFRKDYTMPQSGVVTVPTENGIVVKSMVNGKGPYPIMFDTGSVNLLSDDFARQIGLHLENGKLKFATGSNPVDAQSTHVDTLQIGDLTVHDQTFYVIAFPPGNDGPVGAVGYELMRRLAAKIDYEHKQLTFYNAPTFVYSGNGFKVPLELVGKDPEVKASVDGATGMFSLDTGNEFGFSLSAGFVKQNDLIKVLSAHYHGYSGKSYGGPSADAFYARVKTLRIGDAKVSDEASPEVHNVIAYLYTGQPTQGENAGNIGRSILQQFNVTFDRMRGYLYLEKNANWGKPTVFNRAGIVIDPNDQGQEVMTVLPGSPAEAVGIIAGDVITEIDGHPPAGDPDEPAFFQPAGTVVHLTVNHGNEVRKVSMTLRDLI